ncbi:MAG: hypothetical protein U0869_19800 [Chloroflexota bacterium]
MIDYEALEATAQGRRFDLLTALLIGLIAIVAAALVLLQSTTDLAASRANAEARLLASSLTTRLIASGTLQTYAATSLQSAALTSMEGSTRQIVGLSSGDAAEGTIGAAMVDAGNRLQAIGAAMGAIPGRDTDLDPYAAYVLGSTIEEMQADLKEQNRQADLADRASAQGNASILGLSLAALGGVLVGLAAVLGSGRAGRSLLAVAWAAAIGATVMLAVAAGLIGPFF